MPFKINADRRHHIPKQRHRVTNWAAYEAGLRARGSLTVWFSDEAIEGWRAEARTGRGGQPRYSSLAILTALTLRAVFRLALRQAEGLIGSVLALLGLDLPVPDHTTMSRRAETLEVPPLRSSPSAMSSRRSTSRKTSRPPSEESCSPSERAIRGLPRTGDRPGSKG
jgi:Transposase DDE domain